MAEDPDDDLAKLFHASLDYFDELQRTPEGFYRDAYDLDSSVSPERNKRCSTAAIGAGLVALCIDHDLGRDSDAEKKALTTLRALNGKKSSVKPERDASGFFRHFFTSDTGKSDSEFSTIDTAIMVIGALACRNTFRSPELHLEADLLWSSIDWPRALATPDGRGLFMIMKDGKGTARTDLFSEYFILAWLIREHQLAATGKSKVVTIGDFPVWNHDGLTLASEPGHHPLSSFTVQFPFYLTNPGITDPRYKQFVLAQARADHRATTKQTGQSHLWGCGAGGTPDRGYRATTFADNPDSIVTPHIIAGFLPVFPEARKHLLEIYRDPARRALTPAGDLLPRFSVTKPAWHATRIEAIDYSSMIFGIAAVHPDLGIPFFRKATRFSFEARRRH
jgi:hypothetical protein